MLENRTGHNVLHRAAVFFLPLALVFVAGCLNDEKKGSAVIDELNLAGNLSDFIMADFDGDFLQEILALCVDDNGTRPLRKGCIFSQANGGYKSDPDIIFDIPPDAVVFDTGDIDGDGNPEILYLSANGLYAIKVSKVGIEAPLKIVDRSTIFYLRTPESVSYWDFYRTIRKSGRAFIISPTVSGFSIYSIRDREIESSGDISIGFKAWASESGTSEARNMTPITYRCAIPNIEIFDYTGDGIEDLFVVNRREVSIYAGTLRGEFSAEPVARPGDELWPEASDNGEFNIQVRDLNGDGLADLVISQ